ncbi:MAG: DnaJ domain-containing protein [Paludibacteraceae bacterium]|nr:DnaJ domain-containing protein [Paludibacteraceae bacterium]
MGMILLADVTMDPMLFLFLFIVLPFCLFILFLRLFDDIKNIPEKIRYYRDKISGFIHNPRIRVPEKNLEFITLFAAVVKCDGRVRHKEIEFVKKHIFQSPQFAKYKEQSIRFFESELEDINVRFLGYKTTKVPFFILDRKNISGECISERVSDISANLFSKHLKKYVDRMEFMDVLFQIAYSQAGVSDEEVNLLREVAYSLYIRSWDFTSLLYKYEYIKEEGEKQQKKEQKRAENTGKKNRTENEKNEGQKTSENRFKSVAKTRKMEALQLLEITEGADEQEIKSAYRRLAKMYHPDTLPANASEEEREEVTARFRSIHEAYEFMLEQVVLLKNKAL